MFDQVAAFLTVICLAVAYFEFLMGEKRREALTKQLIRWRDRLASITIRGLPRAEAEFALRPLGCLAGMSEDDADPAFDMRYQTLFIDRFFNRIGQVYSNFLPLFRSFFLWTFILFVLIVLFRELRWKGPASGEVFREVLSAFPLAITSVLSYWATAKALQRYDAHKLQAIVLVGVQVAIVCLTVFALAYIIPIWLYVLLSVLHSDDTASKAYSEAVANIQALVPSNSSVVEQLLGFWPHADFSGKPWTLTGSLFGASFNVWVRLACLGIFLFSWLIAPLTLKFAFLNLRGLLELKRPVLTTCAVTISVVVKAGHEVLKAVQ